MHSPAEQTLENAHHTLDVRERDAKLIKQRKALIGNITDAFAVLHKRDEPIVIEDYTVADGRELSPEVSYRKSILSNHSRAGTLEQLIIQGKLSGVSGQTAELPMYRISWLQTITDSGYRKPTYEICVANQDVDGGYEPLALIEQTYFYSDIDDHISDVQASGDLDSDNFKLHDQLSPAEMAELRETGIYLNSHAAAMLDEVQSILGMAIDQQQVQKEIQVA